MGTQGGGLNLLDRQSGAFTRYQHNPADSTSLSNDYLLPIFEDSSGILWLGTFGSGADYYDPAKNKFLLLRSEPGNLNSLSNNSIWAIHEDDQGTLWIGSNGGGLSRSRPHNRRMAALPQRPEQPGQPGQRLDLVHPPGSARSFCGWARPLAWIALTRKPTPFTHYPMPIVNGHLPGQPGQLLWLATGQGSDCFRPRRHVVAAAT